jgi:chromosome segregation ATPase
MEDAQEVDRLNAKLDEYEKLKHELKEASQKLSTLKEKDGKAVMTENWTSEIEKKLNEKDDVISVVQNELHRHKMGESAPPTKPDFTSLNTSLARFSEEISMAMSELEEAQKNLT